MSEGGPRWKTLSPKDPDFKAYLTGSFSEKYLAIPTRSLNVNSSTEEITFEIIPQTELSRPAWWRTVLRLLRPMTLTISLSPILISFFYMRRMSLSYESSLVISSFWGVLWFHGALNILNDYYDHMRGKDRINPRGGSRVIQLGWIRAYQVRQFGFLLLSIAVLLGLPALAFHPSLLILIALFSLITGLEFSSAQFGFKYRGTGGIILFLLTGPFVSMGFTWAIASSAIPATYWLPILTMGSVFGLATVFLHHLANIEDILFDSQTHSRTLAVQLGFDRAKSFLWVLSALLVAMFVLFGRQIQSLLVVGPLALLIGLFYFYLSWRVSKTASPLSSDLAMIRLCGLWGHWLVFLASLALFI